MWISSSISKHERELRLRISSVRLLRLLKRRYSYKELSEKLGIALTTLNRYVRGHVLPTPERAIELQNKLIKFLNLSREIMLRTKRFEDYVDLSEVTQDPILLHFITSEVVSFLGDRWVNAILVPSAGAVPLATAVGLRLESQIIVAEKERKPWWLNYREVTHIPLGSALIVSYYIPREVLRGRRVLVVDDFARTGHTLKCLADLAEKDGGRVVGAWVILGMRGWRQPLKRAGIYHGCLMEIGK